MASRKAAFPQRPGGLADGDVTLRDYRDDDLADVVAHARDRQMQRWTMVPSPYEDSDARAYVAHVARGWEAGAAYSFVVDQRGRYAGSVSLRAEGAGAADIGYGLAPWARGQQVMSRALRLALGWGVDALDLDVVHWRAAVGNWPSRRVAWSVGFRVEGKIRGLIPTGPGRSGEPRRRDGWVGSLLRGEPFSPSTRWLDPPVLRTPTVVLRPHVEGDAPRIADACADPVTQHWLPSIPTPYTQDDARAHLEDLAEGHAGGRRVAWAVADPGTGQIVGEVSVFRIGEQARRAEIGYWMHPEARGRGLMSAAVEVALSHAFTPPSDGGLGIECVLLRAAEANTASIAVARAAGFEQTGRERRAEQMRDGRYVDLLCFERLAAGTSG